MHVFRSLLVIFGVAFILKFIVLASLSAPAEGMVARAMRALFEGVTLGSVTQPALQPITGYIAFFTLMTYLFGLVLLPTAPIGDDRGGDRVSAGLRGQPPLLADRRDASG
jgi:hypothetical protein